MFFSIIPEIPSKRVHSKRIPKFSETFPEFLPFHSISDRKSRNFCSNGKRPMTDNLVAWSVTEVFLKESFESIFNCWGNKLLHGLYYINKYQFILLL